MNKLAQQRSLRSKLWEKVHLPGKALETLHPEFAAVMDNMRSLDETIRNIAEDIKSLIRAAKSAVRQRDYLNAAFNITEFHRKCRHIVHLLSNFIKSVDVKHFNYLLNELDTANREHLFSYNPTAELKEATEIFASFLNKEAGLVDSVKDTAHNIYDITTDTGANILTERGRARRLLEKRFNASFLKELKSKTEQLLSASIKMLNVLLSSFSMMESGVSRRNVALYIEKSKILINKFNDFDKIFLDYHNKIIGPLKTHQETLDKAKEEELAKQEEIKRQEYEKFKAEQDKKHQEQLAKEKQEEEEAKQSPLVNPYAEPSKDDEEKELSFREWQEEQNKLKQQLSTPSSKEKTNILDKLEWDQDIANSPDEKDWIKAPKKSQEFIASLQKSANSEDLYGLLNNILVYSAQIEDSDPKASAKLLTIAHNMMNDVKIAGLWDLFQNKEKVNITKDQAEPTAEELQNIIKKKDKPKELDEEENNKYKVKTISLPVGRIDKSYTDLEALKNITANRIRITPETTKFIINILFKRLSDIFNIEDFTNYLSDFELNLPQLLKQAVYDGWVISSMPVEDNFNPRDRYIEVYSYLHLNKINPDIPGVAKLHINCRMSANNQIITIKNIKKYFDISNINASQKSQLEESSAENNDEEFDFDTDK